MVAALPIVAWSLSGRPAPTAVRLWPVVVAVLMVLQVAREGQRWQMWPAYLVVVGFLLAFAGRGWWGPGPPRSASSG